MANQQYMAYLLLFMAFSTTNYAQKVTVDLDSRVDFTKYKTYAWLAPGDSVLNRIAPAKLFGGTITSVANQELKSRALQLVTDQPDVIFQFYTGVEEYTRYSQSATLSVGVGVAVPGYYGGPGGYAGVSAPVAGGKVTETTMQDGRLAYSMYDSRTGKLVWSAYVTKTFENSDDISKLIRDYTEKIFKKFPMKKVKN